jgi:hypothetical protein
MTSTVNKYFIQLTSYGLQDAAISDSGAGCGIA